MITPKKIAISTLEIVIRQALAVISIAIMARLLSPSDYGAVVPIYLFSSVVSGLIDFGIGSAIVRFKEIGRDGESTAFWMNMLLSILFSAVLILLSPHIADYFNNLEIQLYVWISSAALIINAAGAVQQNILLRDKEFHTLFWAGIIPQSVSMVAAIWMAYLGFGPLALIAQILLSSIFSSSLLWILSSWRPEFVFKTEVFRKLLSFGFFLTFSGIVNSIYKNSSSALILKGSGAAAAGNFYAVDRLQQYISDFIVNISSRLSFSSFVGIPEKPNLQAIFSYSYKLIVFIAVPIFCGLFAVSDLIIMTVLGEKWIHNSDVLKILSLVGFLWPLELHNQNMIKAVGDLKSYFWLELVKRILGVFTIAIIAFNVPNFIPHAIAILACIFYVVNTWYVGKLINHGFLSQVKDLSPSFLSGAFMAVAVMATRAIVYPNHIIELSISIVVGIISYLIASYFLNRIMCIQIAKHIWISIIRINERKNRNVS